MSSRELHFAAGENRGHAFWTFLRRSGYDPAVIVNCPRCSTSHSKRDEEVADGLDVVCRDCAAEFRITADGKVTTKGGAARRDSQKPVFDPDSTDVLESSDLDAILGGALDQLGAAKKAADPNGGDEGASKRPPTGRRPSTGGRPVTGSKPGFSRKTTTAKKPPLPADLAADGIVSAVDEATAGGPEAPGDEAIAAADSGAGKEKKPTTDELLAQIKDSVADDAPATDAPEPKASVAAQSGREDAAGDAAKPDAEVRPVRRSTGRRPTGGKPSGRRPSGKAIAPRRPSLTGVDPEEQARTAVLDIKGLQSQLDAMKVDDAAEDLLVAPDSPLAVAERRASGKFDDSVFEEFEDADGGKAGAQPDRDDDFGFSEDSSTDILEIDKLRGKLKEMQPDAAEDAAEPPRGGALGLDPSPRPAPKVATPAAKAAFDKWGGLRALSTRGKLIVAGAAVGPAVLTALLLVLLLGQSLDTVYLGSRQNLSPEHPKADSGGTGHELPRGAALTVFETIGDVGFVRAVNGRAGYVRLAEVLERAPASDPEYEFADCNRSFLEPTTEICLRRAQTQFESCRTVCEPRVDQRDCLDRCQARLTACTASCEGHVEPPKTVPKLEEQEADPEAEFAVGEDSVDSKDRKGKRRKRKRRKR